MHHIFCALFSEGITRNDDKEKTRDFWSKKRKKEKTRDIPERASQRQQVNVNPSFWTQQTRNLKEEEDNKRKRERELKRRYKDCCCWSNGHSSELVHIPEKRNEEKQEKNMEEIEKDSFIPLLLTVYFFGLSFCHFLFLLLIEICCLVKHQKEWQSVMSYFMLSCKEWWKEVKEGRKCMPFLLRRIERERRHSNLSLNQSTKQTVFDFSSFLHELSLLNVMRYLTELITVSQLILFTT